MRTDRGEVKPELDDDNPYVSPVAVPRACVVVSRERVDERDRRRRFSKK
jgi:hypothetical protein